MTQNSSTAVQKAGSQSKTLATMTIKEKVNQARNRFFAAYQSLPDNKVEEIWARETGYALQIFSNNDYLTKMDPVSIVTSVANVALTQLTLNPELRLGYLIPRKGKLYFQSSYMGKREILLRAGMVLDVYANLVHEHDYFYVEEGTERKLIHRPEYFKNRGEIVGGYWQAVLQNGEKPFGVMPIARINEIKARSEAVKSGKGSPWDTDPQEMMKKTILNWGFKSLPKTGISDDILKVLAVEAEVEQDEFQDWKKANEENGHEDFLDDRPDDLTFAEAQVIEDEVKSPGKEPGKKNGKKPETTDVGDREIQTMQQEQAESSRPSMEMKVEKP